MPKPSTARRLISYALVYKFKIIGALLILCCAVGAELGGPYITKTIIDQHLSTEVHVRLRPYLSCLASIWACSSQPVICNFSQAYILQSTALQIIKNMRMDLMQHIQRISLRYFDNTPIGQVVSRIANDTEAVRDLFMSFMATFVVSMMQLTGIFVALFILDWHLALFCLVLPPMFACDYDDSLEVFENLYHDYARPAQRYERDD